MRKKIIAVSKQSYWRMEYWILQQAAGHAAKIIIKSVTNGTFANARECDPPQYEQLILFGLSGIFSAVLPAGKDSGNFQNKPCRQQGGSIPDQCWNKIRSYDDFPFFCFSEGFWCYGFFIGWKNKYRLLITTVAAAFKYKIGILYPWRTYRADCYVFTFQFKVQWLWITYQKWFCCGVKRQIWQRKEPCTCLR